MNKANNIRIYQILIPLSLIILISSCEEDGVNPMQSAFISVSAGSGHSLALKSDSTLWAWGANGKGELGDGTLEDKNKPVMIGSDFVTIAAGGSVIPPIGSEERIETAYSLALKSDGTLWAWGYNGNGQLGDNTLVDKFIPEQIGSGYSAISAGMDHTLALKTDGTLWAWGSNDFGKLGIGLSVDFEQNPVLIGDDFVAIAAGNKHSLALKNDGTLWAWGNNLYGELGDGTWEDKNIPVQVGSGYIAIAAKNQSFAIKTDGTIWAWGSNQHGELGDGTEENSNIPVKISGPGFVSISTSDFHSFAIKSDETLWAWNYGGFESYFIIQSTPFQLGAGYAFISAGSNYSLILKTDNSLWAWGYNGFGQLGDGTIEFRYSPVHINP